MQVHCTQQDILSPLLPSLPSFPLPPPSPTPFSPLPSLHSLEVTELATPKVADHLRVQLMFTCAVGGCIF